jgi:hypothetical protein
LILRPSAPDNPVFFPDFQQEETNPRRRGMSKLVEWSDELSVGIEEIDKAYSPHFINAGANPKLKKRSWASRLWDSLHG